jgi:hypothetical protein
MDAVVPLRPAPGRSGPPEAPTTPSGTRRPTREAAMEAVRTLLAWAGDDP